MSKTKLSGLIETIIFKNEENDYTVANLSDGNGTSTKIVGVMTGIKEGSYVTVTGEQKINPQFGDQFEVDECIEDAPTGMAGIEKFMQYNVPGIGPKTARKIVEAFGEKTNEIILNEPDKLLEIGVRQKIASSLNTVWIENAERRKMTTFLLNCGFGKQLSAKVYTEYEENTISIIAQNPYRLIYDFDSIGFVKADEVAKKLGVKHDSKDRIQAGIVYLLKESSRNGHTCLPIGELENIAADLLGVQTELVTNEIFANSKHYITDMTYNACYLTKLRFAETDVAKDISVRMLNSSSQQQSDEKISKIISDFERLKSQDFRLADKQKEAVRMALSQKISILTGGPGTGKTLTIEATIYAIKATSQLAKIKLAAPTGKAAKRMAEMTGQEASTIHRLLDAVPPDPKYDYIACVDEKTNEEIDILLEKEPDSELVLRRGKKYIAVEKKKKNIKFAFTRNKLSPIDCHYLIVDEFSMVDILLLRSLLEAVKSETNIILVGDIHQLPSVGPGNVMQNLIDTGTIPVTRLETIHRQAEGSSIITNAYKINSGEQPDFPKDKDKDDFFFFYKSNINEIPNLLVDLVLKRIPAKFRIDDPTKDIQVLSPGYHGIVGVNNLNQILQKNIISNKKQLIQTKNKLFYVGDKVIQLKNDYENGINNGDIGYVECIDEKKKVLYVNYFDDIVVPYGRSDLNNIALAYVTTVHKSQGCEFPIVVLLLYKQHYMLLQRNLFYTAVTRARDVLVLLGEHQAIDIAVKNNSAINRNTFLKERIVEYVK